MFIVKRIKYFTMIIETEIWRTPIDKGIKYEKFQVSNLGRIINLNYYNTGEPKMMEPFVGGNGYLCVNLYKNRKQKMCYVHRLVAEAFIPNPDNLTEVNHIDEDKTNNRVENLEWKSHKGNCNHGTRNKRMAKAMSKTVLQLTLNGEFVREWESTQECGRNGFDQSSVSACCNGKQKSHKGYKWCYV